MSEGSNWLEAAAQAVDLKAAAAELREMLELRRQLAEAEIRSDVFAVRRFAICAGLAAGLLIIGLPVLVQSCLLQLEEALQLDAHWLSIGTAAGMLAVAALLVWFAQRRLRAEWTGLNNSIAELREDLASLHEWTSLVQTHAPPQEPAQGADP